MRRGWRLPRTPEFDKTESNRADMFVFPIEQFARIAPFFQEREGRCGLGDCAHEKTPLDFNDVTRPLQPTQQPDDEPCGLHRSTYRPARRRLPTTPAGIAVETSGASPRSPGNPRARRFDCRD